MSLKLFIVEHNTGEMTYYAAQQDYIMDLLYKKLEPETWGILYKHLITNGHINVSELTERISWDTLVTASIGYIENERIAFYCETPVTL